MKKILIETDIGQDPDDLFALLYLLSADVEIKAIVLSPGDEFQIAITRFLLKECGKENIPIGVSSLNCDLRRKTRFHYSILDKYGYPHTAQANGYGVDMMKLMRVLNKDIEFFLIGPLVNMKKYLELKDFQSIKRIVMQGGFVPYSILGEYSYIPVERFKDKSSFTTFNLCSYREGGQLLFNAKMKKSFVTKNMCNTLFYNEEMQDRIVPHNRAMELFKECSSILFEKKKEKRLHDVYAAVKLLHPDIFYHSLGKLYYCDDGKCSAYLDDNGDELVLRANETELWDHIIQGK